MGMWSRWDRSNVRTVKELNDLLEELEKRTSEPSSQFAYLSGMKAAVSWMLDKVEPWPVPEKE
jgi:hypothetical protein